MATVNWRGDEHALVFWSLWGFALAYELFVRAAEKYSKPLAQRQNILRHRIVARRSPRMAPAEPVCPQPAARSKAVALNCLVHIGRAARLVPAMSAYKS